MHKFKNKIERIEFMLRSKVMKHKWQIYNAVSAIKKDLKLRSVF